MNVEKLMNRWVAWVTTTLPDGSTQEVQKYALDGTLLSTTGSAVADPSTGDEGVVASTVNNAPGNVTIPAGSTWTETLTNNGSDWTRIYTNLLGQQFYTQQSGPNGAIVSTYTTYDGNGRPITFQDVDGSVTHTDYNPADDSVLDTWVDLNGNGVYDPGVDSKTVNTITPSNTLDSQWAGTTQKDLSASGNQVTQTQSMNSGLDSETISNGLSTSTHTDLGAGDGNYTVTTTNPDGTRTVDTYAEGLLTQEQTLGTSGTTAITTVSYYYDALRRNIEVDDWTGATTFTLRADGSVASMTLPDGRVETVNTQDPNTQTPTEVTRLDGQQQSQSISSAGQTTSQSGAGVTPATYGYDPVTGQLSSLTIFPSGSSTDTTGQETTGFSYDPATGLESRKTYADGSTDTFNYNSKLQLSSENLRGDSASFNYNSAGMQTGASYSGSETTINDSLGTLDDLGRSHVATETTTSIDGSTATTEDVLGYNAQGQVASETQTSGVTVKYDYNSDSSIQDMKLYQNGQVISETDYAYDPISKRLATITINGVTYTYTYKTNTNLIETVSSSANTLSYGYESNTGRLQSITATDSSSTDYSAGYTYTANDQRQTESVLQENPDTQAIDQRNWTFGYDDQDELTSVSDDGSTLYSYNYDGVGNRTDTGSVNAMNQYGDLQYNAQGDVIDDGQFNYTWDAKNRLTSATPDSPDAESQKDVFTYDPENRRTQEDIYNWDSGNQAWVYASSLKFVYDGSQMVAELNGQNQLLQTYTWGPTGTLLSITDYSGSTVKNYQVVTDGSGDVVQLLDSSTGLVAASYQYDPWGNPVSATGPAVSVCHFGWEGEWYDANFGGYYMGAREGSARLHIFLSPDPSGEGSDPNLERMVGNDPVNKSDPSGLSAVGDVGSIAWAGIKGLGHGIATVATTAKDAVTWIAGTAADTANSLVIVATDGDHRLYSNYEGGLTLSYFHDLGQWSDRRTYRKNYGRIQSDFYENLFTVGLAAQGKASINRYYSLINDDQFTQTVGGIGLMQAMPSLLGRPAPATPTNVFDAKMAASTEEIAAQDSSKIAGFSDAEAASLGKYIRGIKVNGQNAIQSVEAYGSRAGSTFRGRPPTAESDLDLFVTIRSEVANSPTKLASVRAQLSEIENNVSAGKGFKINIQTEIDVVAPSVKSQLKQTPFIPLGGD